MKKNNIVLTALLAAIVIGGFLMTYRGQTNNTPMNNTCPSRTYSDRTAAEKETKRNSLRRQIDANQNAIDRAHNQGQKDRLVEKNKKLQNKLNNLQ
jgi:hypothetical protein